MRRVWLVAGLAAATLGGATPDAGRAADHAEHDILAARRAANITGVSVQRTGARAEVVIGLAGDADVQDFALQAPHRIVVDFSPATLKLASQLYDGVVRGGIRSVRVAHYRSDVVRVVLDLDGPRGYEMLKSDGDVRILLDTEVDSFEPWSVGTPARPVAARPAASVVATPAVPVSSPVVVPTATVIPPSLQAQQQNGPRISVTFRDTPLRDVLSVFSERSGRSIVTGIENVRINADIVDQPWQTALFAILDAYGLAAVDNPQTRIIRVSTHAELRAALATEPVNTVRLPLNHAKAPELAVTLAELLSTDCAPSAAQVVGPATPPAGGAAGAAGAAPPAAGAGASASAPSAQVCPARGRIVAEAPTNTLIISEVASRLDSLVAYARSFDLKPQQVNIKVQVISINRTSTQTLGVSYDLGTASSFFNSLAPRTIDGQPPTGEFQVTLGGDAFVGVANAGRQHGAGAAINLIYNTTIGNHSLTSFIDALAQDELADIHAQPSLSIMDKKEARLFVGASTSYLLTPQTAAGAIQSQPPVVSTLETGILLSVTPFISANRTIRMNVSAEQSTLTAITVAGPNASTNRVSNEVIVADGETLVMAGLTQSLVTKTRRGIPVLMSLPVIGRIFSETRTEDRKDDLLILITPHILDDPTPANGRRN